MNIQAIAFDLDDTLLRDDRTISAYTLDVLRRAHEAGVRIIPASGRVRDSMIGFVRQIGCADIYISGNGAQVWSPDHELLMEEALSPALAREIGQFAEDHHCYAQTYAGEHFYYNHDGYWAREYAAFASLTGFCVGNLAEYQQTSTPKVLIMDSPERIAELYGLAKERFGDRTAIACSKPTFLEINPIHATKGNALSWCASRMGFSLENTMAFGDSLNDLSMLTSVGHGVAMGNAWEAVKAHGFPQADANERDGVARYIEEHVLGGQP